MNVSGREQFELTFARPFGYLPTVHFLLATQKKMDPRLFGAEYRM